jgi:drug/metabolite transporter (DMT)-like permease
MTSPTVRTAADDRLALGMAAAIASMFLLAVMNVFAKLLSETHHVVEIAFYRNLIALLPFAVLILVLGRRDILKINSQPRALVARSVVGTISLIATFGAFAMLPMADAQAFLFTASLFVPLLGYFLLKEKVGPYRWSAVIVGFLGVLVMVRPTGDLNLLGAGLALFAALMHATLGTLLRLLGRTEEPLTVTFYFLLMGMLLTLPAMPFLAKMPTAYEVMLMFGAGLSGSAAQMLLSVSFRYAPAALVTIFNYSGIIWATAFGWLIWGDWPAVAVWTGAGIIIASSLFIVWREHRVMQRVTPLAPGSDAPK